MEIPSDSPTVTSRPSQLTHQEAELMVDPPQIRFDTTHGRFGLPSQIAHQEEEKNVPEATSA
jgi:hypothetical protein